METVFSNESRWVNIHTEELYQLCKEKEQLLLKYLFRIF